MQVNISQTNDKLGSQIPSVSLPPEHSCRKDAPCSKGCYGKKGTFLYENVKKSHMHNLACYVNDSDKYFKDIIDFLSGGLVSYKYFRWHTVGDIINYDYFLGMIKVAVKCKGTKFLCFTKKFDIINDYLNAGGTIPYNLKIIFSAWHKGFKVDNPYRFPVAYVNFKNKDMNPDIPELAIPCTGECWSCLSCWTLKKGQSVFFNQH